MKFQYRIGLTNYSSRRPKTHNHNIISNQPMSALNKIKGNLTFTDSALTHQQNPGAVDIEQNPVDGGFGVNKIFKVAIDCIKNGGHRKTTLEQWNLTLAALL